MSKIKKKACVWNGLNPHTQFFLAKGRWTELGAIIRTSLRACAAESPDGADEDDEGDEGSHRHADNHGHRQRLCGQQMIAAYNNTAWTSRVNSANHHRVCLLFLNKRTSRDRALLCHLKNERRNSRLERKEQPDTEQSEARCVSVCVRNVISQHICRLRELSSFRSINWNCTPVFFFFLFLGQNGVKRQVWL